MTNDDLQDEGNALALLKTFAKKAVANDPAPPVTVLRHSLSVMDTESEGYDPYNNPPPPPTEAEIEASMGRPARLKRPK